MKLLKDKMKTNGYYYRMIGRSKLWAIYSQHKTSEDNSPFAYEVFKIEHRNDRIAPSGKKVQGGEYFPSASDWGKKAWTFHSKSTAMDVFLENSKKEHDPTTFTKE